MAVLKAEDISRIKDLYYSKDLCMREIALSLGVSLNAVTYFMRRYNLDRRTLQEASSLQFSRKAPSFTMNSIKSKRIRGLAIAGAMLYWSEGYKGPKSTGLDFANSDPEMIKTFLSFLRGVYVLDERKLRVLLYCYADQDVEQLKRYWQKLTLIPLSQFSKPYVRHDFRINARKMEYGLIHIRYADKKILRSVLELIKNFHEEFAQVDP